MKSIKNQITMKAYSISVFLQNGSMDALVGLDNAGRYSLQQVAAVQVLLGFSAVILDTQVTLPG